MSDHLRRVIVLTELQRACQSEKHVTLLSLCARVSGQEAEVSALVDELVQLGKVRRDGEWLSPVPQEAQPRESCQRERGQGESEAPQRCHRREDYRAVDDRADVQHLCWVCWHELRADNRALYVRLPSGKVMDEAPDADLYDRAVQEREALGPDAQREASVRPFVYELVKRGHVTAAEWAVPMNTYERRQLVPSLVDEVFVSHFLHCAANSGPGLPGTYTWALVHELVPEAVRRWHGLEGVRKLRRNAAYGRYGDGWSGGRFEDASPAEAELIDPVTGFRPGTTEVTPHGWLRTGIDARSAYPLPGPMVTAWSGLRADLGDWLAIDAGYYQGEWFVGMYEPGRVVVSRGEGSSGGRSRCFVPEQTLHLPVSVLSALVAPFRLAIEPVQEPREMSLEALEDELERAPGGPKNPEGGQLQQVPPLDTFNWGGITAHQGKVVTVLPAQPGAWEPEQALAYASWLITAAELAGHPHPMATVLSTVKAIWQT